MRLSRFVNACTVGVALAFSAASAWAQSYSVSAVTGQWATPPGSAVSLTTVNADDNIGSFTTPFPIPYWGTTYSTCYVSSNGYVAFNSLLSATNYSPLTLPVASSATNDGIVMVAQRDGDGRYAPANCNYWSEGTSPNRRMVVSWNSWEVYSHSGANSLNFQVQFYESGRIVIAYSGTWSITSSWGVGLDQPGTSNYITPAGTSTNYAFTSSPTNDWNFAPPITVAGRALYDRYIVDQTGIGNSSELGVPLANMRIEERDAAGNTVASGVTDALGNYNFIGATIASGGIYAVSGSLAGNVRRIAAGPMYGFNLTGGNVPLTANISVGTVTITESNDPGGVARAPINIARTMQTMYDWSKARAPTKVPQLVDPVLWDSTSAAATSYTMKNGSTLASMRVSADSKNPDAWDGSVIRKHYGRHILGAISADPVTTYDSTFDKVTDDQNAFAEGFGYYMNVMLMSPRDQRYYDATSSTVVTYLDLENPALTTSPSSSVAGWVAAALFDLTDAGSNESWDTYDGTGTAGENVFNTVASMSTTTAPTSLTFQLAWITKGYNATSMVRDFIHHGLIIDDADEPNDAAAEPKVLTQFGVVRANRVLNLANEDWYQFTMPDPTNALAASIVYDRTRYASVSIVMQIQDLAGNVLATGSPQGAVGPIAATTGSLPAGDYRVRVALTAGGPLPVYTLQAFSQLAFKNGEFPTWTVNRPISVPVNIKGGVPPYTLVVLAPFVKPDGLLLDGVNALISGQPTGPQPPKPPIAVGGSYTYNFILSAQDSATPPNTASGPVSFTVNDEVRAHFGDYLAFPFSKYVSRELPVTGGTPGFGAAVDEGSLPQGLQIQGGADLRFVGTPSVPGSFYFKSTSTDSTGSAATAVTSGVCCVAVGSPPTGLALGSASCGFYFDALEGASVNLAIKTAKKSPARLLSVTMLDMDGNTVLAARIKAGKGKASVSNFVAPTSGRFYCVVSSATGDNTKISCTGKNTAPKSGAGNNGTHDLVPGGAPFYVDVGALSGATFNFNAKPDKSGVQLHAAYMLDPNGNYVYFPTDSVNEKGGGISFSTALPATGTWRLVIVAKPGSQGGFAYSYRIRQPAGVYTAD